MKSLAPLTTLGRRGHSVGSATADAHAVNATSAPGLGSALPHLHRDWAFSFHICTRTGLSALPHLHRDWALFFHICTRTGLSTLPHLHRDQASGDRSIDRGGADAAA